MGNKKDLTKEQLLKQSRKERAQREIARKQSEAATMIQKMLRSYKANQKMEAEIIGNQSLKIKDTIIALPMLQKKAPAKSTQIFEKGLNKFSKEIVLGLNNLNRTMGSLLIPKIGQEITIAEKSRVSTSMTKLKNGYEKFVMSLVTMINEQHSLIQSQGSE